MNHLPLESVYEASPGVNRRTFWIGYAVEPCTKGVKIEGQPCMTMAEARQFMHMVVDVGADDLVRRFGY